MKGTTNMCTRFVYNGKETIVGFNFDIDLSEWEHTVIAEKDRFFIGIKMSDNKYHSFHGTEAKYRQYTDDDLTRLQEILFFREVGFALKEIKELLDSPHYVRSEALERHVLILEAQKERIEALISLVKDTINGNKEIKFSAFSNAKILELQSQFQEEVLEQWGNTESFREYKTMFSSHSRIKIRKDTQLKNFPLYCPKCKKESLICVNNFKIEIIKEPDA